MDLIGGVDRAGQTRRSGRAVGRRTGFLAAAGVCGGLVLAAGPAQAHTALVRMDPANGATVRRPPVAVTLIFNEAVEPRYAAVVVTAADGTRVSTGKPEIRGGQLRQPLTRRTVTGRYTVAYRVVSDDGHVVANRAGFSYLPSRPPPVTSPPATPDAGRSAGTSSTGSAPDAGSSVLAPGLGVGVGVVAIGAGALLWRRRRNVG